MPINNARGKANDSKCVALTELNIKNEIKLNISSQYTRSIFF